MKAYDFSDFPNVELTGVDLSAADTDTLREIVSPDAVSARLLTRELSGVRTSL